MTPLEACRYAQGIYDPVVAGAFDHIFTIDGVVMGYAAKANVLALRGSATTEDWVKDFVALPAWHTALGFCHAGFLCGMDAAFASASALIRPGVTITGHSLGGAHARIMAGLFAYNKIPVDMLCVFGSPKAGFENLARIIEKSGMKHLSYRNRNDVVPSLPLTIGPLLNFVHTEAYCPLNAAPAEDNLEPLRDHALDLYYAGLLAELNLSIS